MKTFSVCGSFFFSFFFFVVCCCLFLFFVFYLVHNYGPFVFQMKTFSVSFFIYFILFLSRVQLRFEAQ